MTDKHWADSPFFSGSLVIEEVPGCEIEAIFKLKKYVHLDSFEMSTTSGTRVTIWFLMKYYDGLIPLINLHHTPNKLCY